MNIHESKLAALKSELKMPRQQRANNSDIIERFSIQNHITLAEAKSIAFKLMTEKG